MQLGPQWSKITRHEYTQTLWTTYEEHGIDGVVEFIDNLAAAAEVLGNEFKDAKMKKFSSKLEQISRDITNDPGPFPGLTGPDKKK